MRRLIPLLMLSALLATPARARVGHVDVNGPALPDASLADFSFLVPAPAGKAGFVQDGADGHFHFANGKRAKFWGVNVSSYSLNQPDAVIEATAARFRHAGLNMVRLEAADNEGLLLSTNDKTTSRKLNAAYLNRLHKWMAACKKNGLYIYLQLLDFRRFHAADGVPNGEKLGPAAKPYAFFDPKIIALQKEFARQILLTMNPYTHTKPINDPGIALVELANEHGLFIKGSTWRKLVPPYDAEFQGLWNDWLRARYKTTAALDAAWTSPDGKRALQPSESLEQGTVAVPDMTEWDREKRAQADWTDPFRSPARVDDGAHFAYDAQRRYFHDMHSYLRALGVRVPITSTGTTWLAPDVKSVADELDFTAENWYFDHPSFEPDKEWQPPFYYSNKDPLKETGPWNAGPFMATLKWRGKPVIIREWSSVWPNEQRVSSVPLAAAYAAFQDLDGMLAFGYTLRGEGKVGDFAWERDPTRWGLIGLGALMFLRGDVPAASRRVDLAYNDKALFTYQDYLNSLNRIAWMARIENVGPGAKPVQEKAALTLDAQPASPPDALRDALGKLRDDRLNVTDDLTTIGLHQPNFALGLRSDIGAFNVLASRHVLLAGHLSAMAPAYPGFQTDTPYGCLWIASLDGTPLNLSHHYLIKMASVADNTGQQFAPSAGPFYPDKFALKTSGTTPILTEGNTSGKGTTLDFLSDPAAPNTPLRVGLTNGTWEMERQDAVARIACDTPGARFTVPGAKTGVVILPSGQTQPLDVTDGAFVYPKGADRVEVTF